MPWQLSPGCQLPPREAVREGDGLKPADANLVTEDGKNDRSWTPQSAIVETSKRFLVVSTLQVRCS